MRIGTCTFPQWLLLFVSETLYLFITKTCLYNFDSLKPHFYIVKLGFTGVDIVFLISAQKHRLWVLVSTASPSAQNIGYGYSLELPRRGGSNEYPQSMFLSNNIDYGYSLELPRRGGSNEYPQSMFLSRYVKKYHIFLIWKCSVFGGEIFYIFE